MIEENIKYIIFDYGDVLVYPITGNWFITTNFYDVINKDEFNLEKFNESVAKASSIISKKMMTEADEEKAFVEVYRTILNNLDLDLNVDSAAKKLAYDFVYSNNKHSLYSEVKENLERLSKKYKLLMLSDNWPCAHRLLKEWGISKYFEKVYISSEYEMQKKDKVFFDIPLKEFGINPKNVLFIDDKDYLLDIAKEKGMNVLLMDRDSNNKASKHQIINSLIEIK